MAEIKSSITSLARLHRERNAFTANTYVIRNSYEVTRRRGGKNSPLALHVLLNSTSNIAGLYFNYSRYENPERTTFGRLMRVRACAVTVSENASASHLVNSE